MTAGTGPGGDEARASSVGWLDGAVRDVGSLVAFRTAWVRSGHRAPLRAGVLVVLALTAAAAVGPAFVDPAGLPPAATPRGLVSLLGAGYAAFLVVAAVSAVAAGGGRELVPRDQAVAFPISPAADHLGALAMAPLTLPWLGQAWSLLALTAYLARPGGLLAAQTLTVGWLVTASLLAQLVGWLVEGVRRGPHGRRVVVAAAGAVSAVGAAAVARAAQARPHDAMPAGGPTLQLADAVWDARTGVDGSWWALVAALAAIGVLALLAGVSTAGWVAGRPPRDEQRMESRRYPPRAAPTSDVRALLRIDRAGVLRSVPFRRGLLLVALAPGLTVLALVPEWEALVLMPGLVASGAALLFGVNAWCLDGRGVLWRDSLPVSPRTAFHVRVVTLVEVVAATSVTAVALGGLRAGAPTLAEAVAVLTALLVVVVQVVATSLRWSVRRPFAVDLRSARATPAPPLTMVGYSVRLAVSTTVTGLVFSGLAGLDAWWPSPVCAVPFLLWSLVRLARVRRAWEDPAVRCAVLLTVPA